MSNKSASIPDLLSTITPPSKDDMKRYRQRQLKDAMENKTCFTYWYPHVLKLGIPTPKSKVIPFGRELTEAIIEENESPQVLDDLSVCVEDIADFANECGYPVFLKNSLFSGKHDWAGTCFIESEDTDILMNIANITSYWSTVANELALFFVVREMINTRAAFTAFGGLPVTEEFRFFSKDGELVSYQPYWPADSIVEPDADDWEEKLKAMSVLGKKDLAQLTAWANQVTASLTGEWSVDFLKGVDGNWWLIDMAEGEKSFRYNPND